MKTRRDGVITLTSDAFRKAGMFIKEQGRPLEAARFRYAFADGSSEEVLAELSAYRNLDGGFGRAMEPDVRVSESSVLCTSLAF